MIGTISRAALGGAAILTLALSGCSAQGGTSITTASTATTTSASTASTTASSTKAAANDCTPQTTNVAADSASQIVQTLIAGLPKACGFTVTGDLDGAAELPDGLAIQGQATMDSIGNVHVAVLDQGVVVDVYKVSGIVYAHMYEAGQPGAAPDTNVETSWGSVLTSSQVAAAGANFVKLTGSQTTTYFTGGMAGTDALLTPDTLGKDLTSVSSGWTFAGTKTVDGVSCVEISAPSGQDVPGTTIAVNASTGLPVQVAYTTSQGTPSNTLTFSGYGTTSRISAPSGAVDGSGLR